MRLFHIAIATFLLVWGPVLAADEDPIEIFEAATLSKISEEAYDELGADLLESGLSQYDVDRIISKFAADAARCITSAIIKLGEMRSIDTETLMSRSDPGTVNSDYFTAEEFMQLLEPCAYTAAENAGISPW